MNFLKSLFISNYMMMIMGITAYSGWMLYAGQEPIAWAGVMLTSAPLMLTLGTLMMFKTIARTSAHFPLINVMAMAGVGMTLWAASSGMAIFLALLGWAGFVLYAYWYSHYGRAAGTKLRLGATLPAFTLRNAAGAAVTTAALAARPAILIFYRGNWCPLCMAQIKELVARYKELTAHGVRVAFISPQPHANTEALARKFAVDFDFLTDDGNAAARLLGIAQAHGLPMGMQMMGYDSETVLPTVVITDGSGKIIWTHETDNYRIRPEPDTYLEVLRHHHLIPAQG